MQNSFKKHDQQSRNEVGRNCKYLLLEKRHKKQVVETWDVTALIRKPSKAICNKKLQDRMNFESH